MFSVSSFYCLRSVWQQLLAQLIITYAYKYDVLKNQDGIAKKRKKTDSKLGNSCVVCWRVISRYISVLRWMFFVEIWIQCYDRCSNGITFHKQDDS